MSDKLRYVESLFHNIKKTFEKSKSDAPKYLVDSFAGDVFYCCRSMNLCIGVRPNPFTTSAPWKWFSPLLPP